MGEVYLADDTRMRRKVALKVLPQDLAADADRLLRFEREAFAASALNHPNILTIFEFGTEGKIRFLASEFVEGESLRERMDRGAISLLEALELTTQIASALHAAHEAGIIHRDIKPDNVMIRADGYVKVLDFGLAKLAAQPALASGSASSEDATRIQLQTQTGIIMGTVAYMSPEQARGHQVDKCTDIWSLGCVLYEMLTRQQPFRGDSTADALANIIHREPVSIRTLREDANAELDRIVNKTLAKNRAERYQTAKDLVADLKQLQKRLEFEAELERSSSPDGKTEAPTQIIRAAITGQTETRDSIAVLPFSNLSADPDNEYFCDGLAEELLNALSKLDHLKVAARTSAFSFKGKNTNVSEIAQKLSVKTVLEGSVRRSGNRIRITVQLVNASDGYHLWSERYDRELQDIFDVQDEIALAIVDSLKLKLFRDEKAALLKRYTDNTEAYQLYLQGLYCYNKYAPEYFQKGIEFFEKAIKLEPGYAPAYAGLGFCYGTHFYFGSVAPREIVPKWRALINKAMGIDDRLAEVYLSRASIEFYYDWDFAKAESDYQRAIDINPNSPDAHWRYGHFLANCERFDEAISRGQRALELDPLSLVVHFFLARIYLLANRAEQGFEQLRKMQEIEPDFAGGLTQLGGLHLSMGHYEEAIESYENARSLGHFIVPTLSYLGAAYGLAGKRDEACQILDQLIEMNKSRYVSPFSIARVYSGLGENDKAFEWFEKAFEERSGEMVALKTEALAHLIGESVIQDNRFQDLISRIGPAASNKTTSDAGDAPTVIRATAATHNLSTLSRPGAAANGQPVSEGVSRDSSTIPTQSSLSQQQRSSAEYLIGEIKSHKGVAGAIVAVLIALLLGGAYWFRNGRAAGANQISSIAVLPFQNKSGNSDSEYLSDGLAESLIYRLSQVPNLKVSPTSSVFRYKGKEIDAQKIASELGVNTVMSGRMVQRGDNLTISVELIDAKNNQLLWGEQFERKMSELLATQREIATAITQKLQLKLSGEDTRGLTKRYTTDNEAYQHYLQGRFYWNRRTGENVKKAIEQFKAAVDRDPGFALAYAGLADCYVVASTYTGMRGSETLPLGRVNASRAMELDSSLAEPHAALGYINHFEWDKNAAEREYKRAIELNPNYPTAHHWYSRFLRSLGRLDEAWAEIKRAEELDPLSLVIINNVAEQHIDRGDLKSAVDECQRMIDLDPNFWAAHQTLGIVLVKQGKFAEALVEAQKSIDLSNRSNASLAFLGHVYGRAGKRNEAQAIIKELEEKYRKQQADGRDLAVVYTGLDDPDQAFAWLEKAFQYRSFFLANLRLEPLLDPLRSDPRWNDLQRRVGVDL